MKKYRQLQAFTLIEMLIVIVIIGILATAMIPKLQGIQARARDVQRQHDMINISSAISLFYLDHGHFPPSYCNIPANYTLNASINCNWQKWKEPNHEKLDTQFSIFSGFLDGLQNEYLTKIPTDPLTNHFYKYTVMDTKGKEYVKYHCQSTDWNNIVEISYYPERRRKTDIVRSCPNNIPWDAVFTDGSRNRYYYLRKIWIFDDKYSPTGYKSPDGECFDKDKDELCN